MDSRYSPGWLHLLVQVRISRVLGVPKVVIFGSQTVKSTTSIPGISRSWVRSLRDQVPDLKILGDPKTPRTRSKGHP